MSVTITPGSTDSPLVYKDKGLRNVVVGASNVPTELCGWRITNPNSTEVYVKFFNGSSGSITLGTTEPVKEFLVPALGETFLESNQSNPQLYFSTALSLVAVTGLASSSTGAPVLSVDVEIYYYLPRNNRT